jgi:multimeric flavodoxin WrbA
MLKKANLYLALPERLKKLLPHQVTTATTDHLIPGPILRVIEEMESADGFIIATPTWWGMPSDCVKVLLNFLTMEEYRGWRLQGKVAGFMAVCEEDGGMQNCMLMANMLNHAGVFVPPYCMFFYNKGMAQKDSETAWAEKDQELIGRNVTRLAKILAAADSSIARWGYK